MSVLLVQGNARAIPLMDASVSCCVTSPPYWSLRDYNVPNQIGLEKQADCLAWARQEPPRSACCWICAMRTVFKEVYRVMRPEATLWVNCGSSYTSGIIESDRYILRDDLTPAEIAYVLRELASHVEKTHSVP